MSSPQWSIESESLDLSGSDPASWETIAAIQSLGFPQTLPDAPYVCTVWPGLHAGLSRLSDVRRRRQHQTGHTTRTHGDPAGAGIDPSGCARPERT